MKRISSFLISVLCAATAFGHYPINCVTDNVKEKSIDKFKD